MDEGASSGIPVTATTPKSFPCRYATTPGSSFKREAGLVDPLCSPIAHHGDRIPASPRGLPTPSPASKRFMGFSSNARNDIYLKTLLNSPYHKTYTPLSATPGYSPSYQTPVRTQAQSPGPGVTSTPQGPSQPGSGRKFVTPKNIITNPFDVGLDGLHLPAYMSPGLFAVSSTPASEEKRAFCWDIEHIAELNPVDIPLDDIPKQHLHMIPDPETEERAQRAIEKFFASNMIAPSPWSDPKQRKKTVMATPSSHTNKQELMTELQGSIQKSLPAKQGMEDASCQTVLTLPVNFDLQKVLGAYMTHEAHEEGNQQDMLSTSSLRRKLFFHGDTSSLAPSPVKGSSDEGTQSEPMSPKLNPDWNATTPLRNTPAFSSSPIKKGVTPQHRHRRCSSDPEFVASPELSPIVDRTKPHTTKKSTLRSSGMFVPSPTSFCISPAHDLDHDAQHEIMSPIPFEGLSPEGAIGGGIGQPNFAESPGFSPIRPPKTPIRKIMRRSQEESYIQDDALASDEESGPITPVTINSGVSNNSHTPVDYLSPIHKPPKQRTSTFILKSYSCNDLEHTAMDFETAAKPKAMRLPGDIMISSMCETRDFSVSDMDYPDETQHRTSLSNQDTGYQTSSLQSTNPESASLHTNLTNQFGSLPLNSTNQDLAFHTSHLSANQDRSAPPILNLTQQMKAIKKQEEVQRDSPNTSVSKQLFPKEDKIAKNLFSSLEDSDEETPNFKSHSDNRMRFNYDDSALPDESVNFSNSLPFSRFKTRNQDSEFQEEAVISRAKETLAMASSFYPKERLDKAVPVVGDSMDFAISSPQKQFGSAIRSEQSASDVAYHVLQRAGEDLAKFDHFFSSQKKENR